MVENHPSRLQVLSIDHVSRRNLRRLNGLAQHLVRAVLCIPALNRDLRLITAFHENSMTQVCSKDLSKLGK
jgi:hypothetical protein